MPKTGSSTLQPIPDGEESQTDQSGYQGAVSAGATNEAPPRPPTPAEIVAMMNEAAAVKKRRSVSSGQGNKGSAFAASFWLLWGCVGVGFAALAYFILSAPAAAGPGLYAVGGFILAIAMFIAASASHIFSPILLAGVMLRRAGGKSSAQAVELAGADILSALGLAEDVLDADEDARLVTRRDGVVTYANRAYFNLAREAGVAGPAGLPPRIDRLFAQQGGEATKVFRLCRAAKGGEAAEETIGQFMGLQNGGRRRRFEVRVNPIKASDDHVAWRLRELPAEEEHDMLAAAYADFPRAVFALEKSGQIAWTNAAMRAQLGFDRGSIQELDDIILGETSDLVRALWKVDRAPGKALIRRRNADPVEATLVAFRRGGVGEGFVCVDLTVDMREEAEEDVTLSGDISESPFGVAIVEGEINRDGRVIEANKAFTEAFGGAKKNTPLAKLLTSDTLEDISVAVKRKNKPVKMISPVEMTVGAGAQARTFSIYPRPVRRRRGAYGARKTLLYTVDITDRKRMEEDYAQDQKLRGIGEIASKVAHDFNNYLQVVLGHCERLMLKHPAGDPSYTELIQIRENAQRAANTTKQLLAFSRKQTLKREVLSVTEILRDFSRFLTRAIGEKVRLELVNGRGLPLIKVDRYQFETAIMNLAVNARDAMSPAGGVLTIRTQGLSPEEIENLSIPGLAREAHILIEVNDSGPGVPQAIADKIFDPFFTTKDKGKGTGLGLSTVYGIIKQMGGAVTLKSEDGQGAQFNIYLPAHDGDDEAEARAEAASAPADPQDLTGAGRILIVEDEDPVRAFVVATLSDCGYEITEAEDGEYALEIIAEEGCDYDLVISDVMMNVLDGPSFVAKAREQFGMQAKVIFMSAYAESAVREQLDIIEGAGYIQKPFTLRGLATQVKTTLYPLKD